MTNPSEGPAPAQAEVDPHRSRQDVIERILRSPLPTFLADHASGEILAVNDAAATLYGYRPADLVGGTLARVDPGLAVVERPATRPAAARLHRREHVRAGGGRLVVDVITERIQLEDAVAVRATIRPAAGTDGPARVELTRIHQAMAEVNRTALSADREEAVWEAACRIVTETAGYRMASIATPGPDGLLHIRVARGAVGDYLQDARVDLADPGATPTGVAAAERRTVVIPDIADPLVATPNQGAALRNGYRSACLIPLLHGDDVFGILAVFAGEPDGFDAAQVALLEQLAGDLGLAHALHVQARRVQASEERYRLLVERAVDGITTHDAEGRFLDANPAFLELLGLDREELVGRSLEEVTVGPPLALSPQHAAGILEGRPVRFEQQVRTRDGRVRVLDVHARLLPDGLVEAVERDVTAQREMEAQLAQAAKMEAVGQLAGGVAHDFNNILTAIGGYASLVRAGLPDDSPLLADVGEIAAATSRAQALTSQLLAFGRRSMLEPRLVDVRAVVLGLERMLRSLIGEEIALEAEMDEHPVVVSVDPASLEHALVNLAVNARYAMPGGGRLRIRVHNARDAAPGSVTAGSWAVISVADTGVGMAAEVLARAFEPFYTTRERGQGTGLGLAMVDGFMRQSGGDVRVASEPGRGTTFWLRFPAAGGEIGPSPAAPTVADEDAGRPAAASTILVVEDEPVLRRLAERALGSAGHRLLVAADGQEALRVAAACDGPIDLLFTDVVMPGLRGPALAEALHAQRPGLRVLFASGYTEGDFAGCHASGCSAGFLAKPYTPAQLRAAVASILGRR